MKPLNDGLVLAIELGNDDTSGVKCVSKESAQTAFRELEWFKSSFLEQLVLGKPSAFVEHE